MRRNWSLDTGRFGIIMWYWIQDGSQVHGRDDHGDDFASVYDNLQESN